MDDIFFNDLRKKFYSENRQKRYTEDILGFKK